MGQLPRRQGPIGTNKETHGPAPDLSSSARRDGPTVPARCRPAASSSTTASAGTAPRRTRRSRRRPAIAVHYMPGWTRYEPQGRTHLVEQHITVAPGEVLQGDHFPTVMQDGRLQETHP